jgi:hypothetical protein
MLTRCSYKKRNGENVHPALTHITGLLEPLNVFEIRELEGVFKTRYEPTPRNSEFSISGDLQQKGAIRNNLQKKG